MQAGLTCRTTPLAALRESPGAEMGQGDARALGRLAAMPPPALLGALDAHIEPFRVLPLDGTS